VDIHGKERLEAVTIAKVDERRRPIPGTEQTIPCDTLLLSCGLIPENELTAQAGVPMDRITNGALVDGDRQTEAEGIFACGNVLHVHDLVDFVSEESAIAGRAAAAFVNGKKECSADITLKADGKIRYTVPQRITVASDTTVYFRVSDVFRDKKIVVRCGDEVLLEKKKIKLAPAEMETVLIKKEMIEKIGSGEISLELV
jgi:lactam utilization protein B